jgi:hypothetical protein
VSIAVYDGAVLAFLFFCASSNVELQRRIKKKWSNLDVIMAGMIHLA